MRIISGSARGRRLANFSGRNIRPTADRVREALFSMLFSQLGSWQQKRVLDLFAGTGALALEAVSRGASEATLVEQGAQAVQLIRQNIQTCGFSDRTRLVRQDVLRFLSTAPMDHPFDIIFADPPYSKGLADDILKLIASRHWLAADGVLCLETAADDPVAVETASLVCDEVRNYGSTTVRLFVHRMEES